MPEATSPALFNCAVAWDGLQPEQQRRIGIAAVTFVLATGSTEQTNQIGIMAAAIEASQAMEERVGECIPNPGTGVLLDLAAINVRSCTGCGCTDQVGCPEGCAWAGDRLCSRCAARR